MPKNLMFTPDGGLLSVGLFEGDIDFDPGTGFNTLSSILDEGIYLHKVNASGQYLWAKALANVGYNDDIKIVGDAQGNFHILAYLHNTADLDPGPGIQNTTPASSSDIFDCKFDPNGNLIWARSIRTSNLTSLTDATTDAQGNIYLIGSLNGTMECDPGPGTFNLSPTAQANSFFIKLDAAGNFDFAQLLPSNVAQRFSSIAVTPQGDIILGGTFGFIDADLGPGVTMLQALGGVDVVVAKYDPALQLKWARMYGGYQYDILTTMELGASGNVYSFGSFTGNPDMDPSPNSSYYLGYSAQSNSFAQVMDSNGIFVRAGWIGHPQIGFTGRPEMVLDDEEHLTIWGTNYFAPTEYMEIDFSMDSSYLPLELGLNHQIFLVRYTPDLEIEWAGSLKYKSGGPFVKNMAVSSDGSIAYCGLIGPSEDLDPSILGYPSLPEYTGSVVKLGCSDGYAFLSPQACSSYEFEGQTLDKSGIYHFFRPGSSCDSILTLNLDLNEARFYYDSVNQQQVAYGVSGAQYQWYVCSDGLLTPILGQTDSILSLTNINLPVALVTTLNGCTDTSDCHLLDETLALPPSQGIEVELAQNGPDVRVRVPGLFTLTLMDVQGRILSMVNANTEARVDLREVAAGVYVLRVNNRAGLVSRKVFWPGN